MDEHSAQFAAKAAPKPKTEGKAADGKPEDGKSAEGETALVPAAEPAAKPAVERTTSSLSSWLSPESFEAARKRFVLDASSAFTPPIVAKAMAVMRDPKYFPELEWEASIRRGLELCEAEQQFRKDRLPLTHRAIEAFIGEKIDNPEDVPIVAIGGSGGGCRAMTYSAGAFSRFSELGVLDCATYLAGVSGSTWAIAACVANDYDFDRMRVQLGHVLSQGMVSFSPWLAKAWVEILCGNPIVEKFLIPEDTLGPVDLWSALIAGALFGENPALRKLVVPTDADADPYFGKLRLRKLSLQKQDGTRPMPIFQVVRDIVTPGKPAEPAEPDPANAGKATELTPAVVDGKAPETALVPAAETNGALAAPAVVPAVIKWLPYEFTAFEFGTTLGGGNYVPTWGFGRRFEDDKELDKRAEISFATILGICSSAFTANVTAVFENFESSLPTMIKTQLDSILAEKGSMHVVEPAKVRNPFFRKPQKEGEPADDVAGDENIAIMDAGMWDNIPFAAMMHPARKVDVMVALENSREPGLEANLRLAEAFAKEQGLKFPELPEEIPKSVFTSDVVTRFRPKDPTASDAPEVVYLPSVKTPGWEFDEFDPATSPDASTFAFQYNFLSFELLWNNGRRNVGSPQALDALRSAIRDAYHRKKARRLAQQKVFGLF
ncbi:acyl transferase/acyl hydrolase/lysophospholipase [Hyaloraphidium curvatum]|nr:acyl transferase/acyl hydrolase/lysophospholipase [Hyaloraphidium curvatum]